MRSVSAADNVIPFRRPAGLPTRPNAYANAAPGARSRAEQRSLMDIVYATGTFILAADDRDTKLVASRLQVYGFLSIEEIGTDGSLRRLRPSEAIRARAERPWRLTKAAYGADLGISLPAIESYEDDLDTLDAS